MTECLKLSGKEPDERDRLMMLVMTGERTDIHCFRREVGIGSRSQNLSGDERMILVTSSLVTGWNSNRLVGVDGGSGVCGSGIWLLEIVEEILIRSWSILSLKYDAKDDERLVPVVGDIGRGDDLFRWRILLTVCHSFLGFPMLPVTSLEWKACLACFTAV
jgi:hypothetical protein